MIATLSQRIAQAWILRINLRTEECFSLIAQLKHEVGLPSFEIPPSRLRELLQPETTDAVASVAVLSSYMLRQTGEESAADRLLDALEAELGKRGAPRFEVAYERGRCAFFRGDYAQALEHFLRAAWLAQSKLHRLWGLTNALLSMENLGIPYARTRDEIDGLVDELKATTDVERVARQLFALRLRECFRQGRFSDCLALEAARNEPILDQGRYFVLWLRALPFHEHFRPIAPEDLGDFVQPGSSVYHRTYRLRTLHGFSHPQDSHNLNPSEWADRFYLWVWRWLQDPSAIPVQKIAPLFADIECDEVRHRLSLEDHQLVRNAALWLSLFDPRGNRAIERFLGALKNHHGNDFAILQLEFLVVSYFIALRDGQKTIADDYRNALQIHPLWTSKENTFRELVEKSTCPDAAVGVGSLSSLALRLRGLVHGEKETARLHVDMNRFSIREGTAGKRVVSTPLCLALHLLNRRPIVTCEEFLETTFGIKRYDSTIHASKVFNLLARLRSLTGRSPSFRMKEGNVIAEGSWSGIEFASSVVSHIGDFLPTSIASARADVAPTPRRGHRSLFESLSWDEGLTREQIERQLATPRSTANRWISRWIEEGRIRRTGQSRRSTYYLAPQLRKRRVSEDSP